MKATANHLNQTLSAVNTGGGEDRDEEWIGAFKWKKCTQNGPSAGGVWTARSWLLCTNLLTCCSFIACFGSGVLLFFPSLLGQQFFRVGAEGWSRWNLQTELCIHLGAMQKTHESSVPFCHRDSALSQIARSFCPNEAISASDPCLSLSLCSCVFPLLAWQKVRHSSPWSELVQGTQPAGNYWLVWMSFCWLSSLGQLPAGGGQVPAGSVRSQTWWVKDLRDAP